jgi:Flp pilus assembly protein TadD
MKARTTLRFAAALLAVLLPAISMAARTQNTETLLEQANKAAASSPTTALAIYELVIEQSAGRDPKVFGRTQGEYWKLITKLNDFSRAFDFFSRLAETHPSSPDVLGAKGAAIG